MIDDAPLFVDPFNHDPHITHASPCRNSGNNGVVTVDLDFDGDPRIEWGDYDGVVDMGVDEFCSPPLLYCIGDLIPGQSMDLKFLGPPEEIAILFLGIGILNPPFHCIYGDWFLEPPVMTFFLGPIPGDGLITLQTIIPPDFPVPAMLPLQGIVNDRLTNLCRIRSFETAEMSLIPGGEFTMGDHHGVGSYTELPVHSVTLDPFKIDVLEISNADYCAFLNSAFLKGLIEIEDGVVCRKDDGTPYCDTTDSSPYSRIICQGFSFSVAPGKANHPMVEVSWYGAVAYSNWLGDKEGRPHAYNLDTWEFIPGYGSYRLPTEAEWEYASRGGNKIPYYKYPWGNTINNAMANNWDSDDPYEGTYPNPETCPVGYYNGNQIPSGEDMANNYGLYDMSGNVNEWCNDRFSSTYYSSSPSVNPKGPKTGSFRVTRGGSWDDFDDSLRCAHRSGCTPDYRDHTIGFRLVLEVP
ncbi:MAG: formylglycine-generating enzyme family protein, partial [Planctomycetes bacterium]|nr:formylglycine-generating enzyme family protein [Planctomycetota bacterium]